MDAMNTGALLPVWLLGAPRVLAILEKMRTPRATVYSGSTDTRGNRAPAR